MRYRVVLAMNRVLWGPNGTLALRSLHADPFRIGNRALALVRKRQNSTSSRATIVDRRAFRDHEREQPALLPRLLLEEEFVSITGRFQQLDAGILRSTQVHQGADQSFSTSSTLNSGDPVRQRSSRSDSL